jgi:mannose-1-phosphate guanylyltransferase
MKCMILAAGLGTRLRPITNKIPKPAVEMLNVPMLYYTGELLRSLNPSKVIVNAHQFPEKIEAMAAKLGFPYEMSIEKTKPLGSGGGIKHAQKHLDGEPFFALNADNTIIPASEHLLNHMLKTHQDGNDPLATLLVIEDKRVGTEFNGVWFNSQNELKEITKIPINKELKGWHFTGIAIYSPRIFKYLPPGESNIFADSLSYALKKGERVINHKEMLGWVETGDAKSYLAATEILLKKYESLPFLKNLVTKYSPDSVYKKDEARISLISSSAKIAPDLKRKGFLVVGENAEIKNGSTIIDSVVLPGAKCNPGITFQNEIIL